MRDPYEVLGIRKDSDKDEIKKRYDILLRMYKAYKNDPDGAAIEFDIDEVNAAYNHLMGYDLEVEDPNAGRRRPVLNILKIDPAGFDNFLHYNKYKLIGGAAIVLLIVLLVSSIINNPPIDFNMKLMGDFFIAEDKRIIIEDRIDDELETVDEALVDTNYAGGDSVFSIAMIQKFAAEIAAKNLDIVLCDMKQFNSYVSQGVFLELSGMFPEDVLSENERYYYDGLVNESEHISGYFGINVTDRDIFKDIFITDENEEIIFCVIVNTQKMDAVNEFIRQFLYDSEG